MGRGPGVAVSCGGGRRHRSWRLVAVALICPLAKGAYAEGTALKRKKKKKKKVKKREPNTIRSVIVYIETNFFFSKLTSFLSKITKIKLICLQNKFSFIKLNRIILIKTHKNSH